MTIEQKIKEIIGISWASYKNKVASRLLDPENEKMMQLQLALIIQTLIPIFEFRPSESIKVLLEEPVNINRQPSRRIIDIVILHSENNIKRYFPVELKCFREFTRDKTGKKRGAQNLGMYDYWADIENIEQYSNLNDYGFGTQLTLTDDNYYVTGRHQGNQVAMYSTNNTRINVTGTLQQAIVNRLGRIDLNGIYAMNNWERIGDYHFIRQETGNPSYP